MRKLTLQFFVVFCWALLCNMSTSAQIINTIAGNGTVGYAGDGGAATSAQLNYPAGVAVDGSGNVYIADRYNQRIRKTNVSGVIATIAGNGIGGYGGDGGPATSAQLEPSAIAVDGSGNVFIADVWNHRIRKVNASGIITTIAGTGTCGYSGDSGPATSAQLCNPIDVAVDGSGNIYIADFYNNRIRKINASGVITTIAGNGTAGYSGDGGSATSAQLNHPLGVDVDGLGNVYIADWINQRIRKINASGVITTIAGTGTAGYSGDGGPATSAQLNEPKGVAVDGSENVYIVDFNNHRIRKINASGVITTIAGTGTAGYSGDGGPATSAQLNSPQGVTVDGSGNVYIADFYNNRIRKICAGTVNPSVSISASANNICPGTSVTFTAIPTNGGTAPAYQWQVNGINTGTNSSSYSYNPANGDVVSCVLTSNATCVSPVFVTSNSITMSVPQSVSPALSISVSQNNVCAGTSVIYMAIPINGGTNPSYQWKVNGTNVGTNSINYSYNPANGDVVTCVLTSNATCASPASVSSNSVTMIVNPSGPLFVSVIPSKNFICAGTTINFTATPINAGIAPNYQWQVNGISIFGANGTTYAYAPADSDMVSCILISNTTCSNPISAIGFSGTMIVYPTVTPAVTIAVNPGTSVHSGQQVVFTINTAGSGAAPLYQWRKNGVDIPGATQASYIAIAGTDIQNNDQISLWIKNTGSCGMEAVSNALMMMFATGIESIGSYNNSLTLFPNPNDGSFTVKGSITNKEQHTVNLEVYNTIGQSIYKQNVTVTNGMVEHQVKLAKSLPSGNYFLKLNDGGNSIIRFTIENN